MALSTGVPHVCVVASVTWVLRANREGTLSSSFFLAACCAEMGRLQPQGPLPSSASRSLLPERSRWLGAAARMSLMCGWLLLLPGACIVMHHVWSMQGSKALLCQAYQASSAAAKDTSRQAS